MLKKRKEAKSTIIESNERNSNLEFLRIIAMIAIICHHYVVNSGITASYDFANVTINMIFLQLWGAWGKTAINVFVLITGYFMCVKKLTWQRFIKLLLEVLFYRFVIFTVLIFTGHETISFARVLNLLFADLHNLNSGFVSSFLVFYLFIPFYNILIKQFNKDQLLVLILMLIGMFTISSTFFINGIVFHYVGWYMTLYFIAAYIRQYKPLWAQNNKICIVILVITVLLSYLSVIVVDFIGYKVGFVDTYHMFSDSNKLFALIIGVMVFSIFINLKPRYNKVINNIAATTFGVLLIHANSDAMRTFLWQDILKVPLMYTEPISVLISHAFLCAIGVFIICSLLDLLRIYFLEKPVFRWIKTHEESIVGIFKNYYGYIRQKLIKWL